MSQEYLLQGSVLNDSVDLLLHRLRGMSDNSEDGLVKFKDHEIVYFMREPGNSGIVSIRVRHSLLHPDQPWLICYLGHPELGDDKRLTTVRTCIEANCSSNVCAFLTELGFRLDYEYVAQGWRFRKSRIRASVSKICKVMNPANLDQLAPVSKSHLVEVSMISKSSDERAAQDVSMFSEQLKPLVKMEKKDPRRPD